MEGEFRIFFTKLCLVNQLNDWILCRDIGHPLKRCLEYDTKLPQLARLRFWRVFPRGKQLGLVIVLGPWRLFPVTIAVSPQAFPIYLSIYLSRSPRIYLYISLSLSIYVNLSYFLYIYPNPFVSISLSFFPSLFLSIPLSHHTYPFYSLHINPSLYPNPLISIHPSIYIF